METRLQAAMVTLLSSKMMGIPSEKLAHAWRECCCQWRSSQVCTATASPLCPNSLTYRRERFGDFQSHSLLRALDRLGCHIAPQQPGMAAKMLSSVPFRNPITHEVLEKEGQMAENSKEDWVVMCSANTNRKHLQQDSRPPCKWKTCWTCVCCLLLDVVEASIEARARKQFVLQLWGT